MRNFIATGVLFLAIAAVGAFAQNQGATSDTDPPATQPQTSPATTNQPGTQPQVGAPSTDQPTVPPQTGTASTDQPQVGTAAADQQKTKEEKKEVKAEKQEAKAAEKGKAMHLTGWVKTEGDKTVFVNDKDKQTWNVANPDALKGHDGQHVKVEAKINETDKSVEIEKVKMLRESKQAGTEKP